MSKSNPLAGLIANYGDSDEESDDGMQAPPLPPEPDTRKSYNAPLAGHTYPNTAVNASGAVHPAPIPHCPWSACYDESSGFTYYWNQQTNAVTWEAPPEYLLALKLAQQQLHVADSESNDEGDTPTKPVVAKNKTNVHKKAKVKPIEYGPALPPANYTVPIGPELPPELMQNGTKSPGDKIDNVVTKSDKKTDDDSQDESTLFLKLKSQAKILEKLGGELPKDLKKIINDDPRSGSNTPKRDEISTKPSANIDDLLEEIEKKELPKVSKLKNNNEGKLNGTVSAKNSPKREVTPPVVEVKPLFPSASARHLDEAPATPPSLPPTPPLNEIENEDVRIEATEKKGVNLYLMDIEERRENVGKKKLRISNSVLPDRKKTEEPAYTTKYSQVIEGFSGERTGLGFSKEDEDHESPKNTINYGNGLMFTKGETLNEDKKDEDLDDLTDLVEAKLKYLNQVQPCVLTPVQEMLIQMQTLVSAFRAGALSVGYWRRWAEGAAAGLAAHEARAAPPGWTTTFQRSEGRYSYRREADGLVQWEYPATTHTDMEICTTPPHPGSDAKEEIPPPLPPTPPPMSVPSPPSLPATSWHMRTATPPPPVLSGAAPAWSRARTPPPPSWMDPPPPGCDDIPPLPVNSEPKQEIGDELASFYSDIAELEKQTSAPHTASNSPEPVDTKEKHREKDKETQRERDRERENSKEKESKVSKKKSKVKISASVGLKHKSVSNLVAKWQQVADEIHSD
ncbi:hypothetical protein HF086_005461 [Spodoptera exigua]|uniref:WW domain-containing protein n=1 Tax=Spodoptera exigua TaxID=7107 RepID=A0A922SD59_SPOEX|nr:hypothetical protein HF086_005461 [Spodoptera exigua]